MTLSTLPHSIFSILHPLRLMEYYQLEQNVSAIKQLLTKDKIKFFHTLLKMLLKYLAITLRTRYIWTNIDLL
jgi:hypothetical protein